MDNKQIPVAVFESRKPGIITCPHCWTEQHSDRDCCYQCAAPFVFLDECEKDLGA